MSVIKKKNHQIEINLLQTQKSLCIMDNVELRSVSTEGKTKVIGGEIHAKH